MKKRVLPLSNHSRNKNTWWKTKHMNVEVCPNKSRKTSIFYRKFYSSKNKGGHKEVREVKNSQLLFTSL
jgi:hypothetical protein